MNRQLAKAVIAAFSGRKAADVRNGFSHFDERDWMGTLGWLHTSGLALYFLARAKELEFEDVVPTRILRSLKANYAENCERAADMFGEFVKMNMEFQRAKLSYTNLKGFSLAPSACTDFACRYQQDLDFLVSRRDAERCREAVERHGYRLTAVVGTTMEFRAGPARVLSMRDLYKARTQRELEVHVASEDEQCESKGPGNLLTRLQLQIWNGFEFPALSECDKLIQQALHLFKHIQNEWTRTSWVLEYAAAIRAHRGDASFWEDAAGILAASPDSRVGIGLATLITTKTFGTVPPESFVSSTVDAMPRQVRLWANRYQNDLVFAERPGSKLYLLLKDALVPDQPDWKTQKRRRLFPLFLPPKEWWTGTNGSSRSRANLLRTRLRFLWIRFRFHVTAGLHYWVESGRFKKVLAELRS